MKSVLAPGIRSSTISLDPDANNEEAFWWRQNSSFRKSSHKSDRSGLWREVSRHLAGSDITAFFFEPEFYFSNSSLPGDWSNEDDRKFAKMQFTSSRIKGTVRRRVVQSDTLLTDCPVLSDLADIGHPDVPTKRIRGRVRQVINQKTPRQPLDC